MSDINAKLAQTSFAGGIWSEILAGRTDFSEYKTAVETLTNFFIYPQGPVCFRSGFRFIAGVKNNAKTVTLIPFVFSSNEAYVLEFGEGYIRFFNNQAQVLNTGVPYEISNPYAEADLKEIRYTQSADVLYLFHKNYRPRKLMRLSENNWVLSDIFWYPPPTIEKDIIPNASLSLAALTGNSITFTTSTDIFLAGDVNRLITAGTGRASITSFVDTKHVICDIISTFEATNYVTGNWKIQGSPNAPLVPSIQEPKNAICTLSSETDLFRSEDVGKYIRINSGLIYLTEWSSCKIVKGQILQVLTAVDEATNWTLENEMWNTTDGYPCCGTFFEERLIVAGSVNYPETIWGSVVGDYENFAPGIDDSDALQFTILSRKVNTIKWIEPADYLIVGTTSSEWRVGPEDTGEALTPLNVIAKQIMIQI